MQNKTIELIDKIKRSTGKPKLTLDHIRALTEDCERLGKDAFMQAVSSLFAPKAKAKKGKVAAPKDPLIAMLDDLRLRTDFDMKTFVNHVADQIDRDCEVKTKWAKSGRSLPKLVEHYKPKVGDMRLEAAATAVADYYSRVH